MEIMIASIYSVDGKVEFKGRRVTPGLAYLLKVQAEFRERGIVDGPDSFSGGNLEEGEYVTIRECVVMALFSPRLMIAAAAVFCFFLPVRDVNSVVRRNAFLTVAREAVGAVGSVTAAANGPAAASTASVLPRHGRHSPGERRLSGHH